MDQYRKMSIAEKMEALELHSISLQEKAKTLQVLPNANPQDNQLQRALMQLMYSNQAVSYPNNNLTFIDKGYTYNPHIYTVISWKGRNVSQVQWELFRIVDKEAKKKYLKLKSLGEHQEAQFYKKKSLEEVDKGGLYSILQNPNPGQSMPEFIREVMGFMDLTGNLYTYGLQPSGFKEGLFSEIYIAPSQLMEIISGGLMNPVISYKVNYSFDASLEIPANRICHQKNWNPRTDYLTGKSLYGLSPMEPLLRELKRSNQSNDAHNAMIEHGGPAGVLSNDGDYALTTTEREAAQKYFDENYQGGININKIIQASSKVSWVKIGLPVADLQLLEGDKEGAKKVSNVYGIPHIIFSNEAATYNNLITAEKDAWQNTLIPECKKIRDGVFNKFLTPAWSQMDNCEYYVDFDTSEIPCLQTDLKEQTERLIIDFGAGLYTIEQMLAIKGIEIPEGEKNNPLLKERWMDNKYHKLGEAPQNPNFSANTGK